jgi:hypothetical protein
MVIKVTDCTLQNQDPVLNECAARLGVSLRQTEDTLTRDMLASTASFINCTGGTNGKIIAVLKSWVIDLELLWDNKGQASVSCAA